MTRARHLGEMLAALAALALAACGSPPAPHATPSNHATGPAVAPQRLTPLVVEEINSCKQPHPVEIRVDGVVRTTVIVPCPPPPPPRRPGQSIVLVTDSSPEYRGTQVVIAPGNHHVTARDRITGLEDGTSYDFPVHSYGETTEGPLADVILIVVHSDWIQARLAVEARLIM